MTRVHQHIQLLLYDYAVGGLSPAEIRDVEEHVLGCESCAAELEQIREFIALVPPPATSPADQCSPEFWTLLVHDVERALPPAHVRKSSRWSGALVDFFSLPLFRPRVAIALTGLLVLIVAGTVTWEYLKPTPAPQVADTVIPAPATSEPVPVEERTAQYFRRSRALLVGLSNMPADSPVSFDLTPERRLSRELVEEARFLRKQPLDSRSVELVGDLEKIFVEVANLEDQDVDIAIIRSGIRRENLLFKIRVAETLYDRTILQQARYER